MIKIMPENYVIYYIYALKFCYFFNNNLNP